MSFEFSDWWLMIFGTHSLISFHLTTGSELRRGHLIGTSGQNPSRPHKPGVVYQVGWRSPELIHWVHPGRSFWFAYNPYQISEFILEYIYIHVFLCRPYTCPLMVKWRMLHNKTFLSIAVTYVHEEFRIYTHIVCSNKHVFVPDEQFSSVTMK